MNAKPIDKEQIFNRAAEIANPAERAAYLDETCSGNGSLRAEIEALLRHDNDAGSFLEHPADEFLATIASRAFETVHEDAVGVNLDFLQHSEKPGCLGTLDAYSVVDVVGYGGMGIVLRAHDAKLNRVVAIKVMAPELAANATAVKRFLREAQAVAAISHDHVVTIHAVNDVHRPPYLVMEFIDGQSLQEKIDRCGALPLTEILRIGMQMARGLAAAHEQGLVHRDIKPANILLENGVERVKITDFGLARAVDDVGITQTGEIAGTPQYMSPEQAQGHPIDERSDLFSLGSVLYTMSTGRPAFRANTSVAMLRRITDDTPHSICELNNDIPDWFEAIIFELLAKDPDERFRSARDVGDLLSGHLAHLQNPATAPRPLDVAPVVAGSHRQAKQSTSDPATRRWPSASILGPVMLVVMLLVGAGFAFWRTVDRGTLEIFSDDPSVTVQIGRPIRETPGGGSSMNIVERAQGAGIVKLPSGPYRLVCNSRGFIVTPGLFVLGRGERVVVKVRRVPPGAQSFDNDAAPFCRYMTDGPSRLTSVAVSPDGRYLAAGDVAGALTVWDVNYPLPQWSQSVSDPQGSGTSISDVAFTPDGRGILTGSEDSTVRLKDAKTGRELRRFVGHTGWVSALAVSRDGKRLVTGSTWYAHHHQGRDGDNTLRLWDLETAKEIRRLDDPGWAVKDVAFSTDGLFVVAGGESHTAGIWDVESGKQVMRLNTPRNLHSVAFAPDGRTVATGHMAAARKEGKFYDPENCVAILWDSASGQEVRRFIGHSAPINSIAFSADGKLLATGSGGGNAADGYVEAFDNTVRVWNVASGKELEQFDAGSNVNAVAFAPDGQHVLSAGGRRAD